MKLKVNTSTGKNLKKIKSLFLESPSTLLKPEMEDLYLPGPNAVIAMLPKNICISTTENYSLR
jgi:hypothetical protein